MLTVSASRYVKNARLISVILTRRANRCEEAKMFETITHVLGLVIAGLGMVGWVVAKDHNDNGHSLAVMVLGVVTILAGHLLR